MRTHTVGQMLGFMVMGAFAMLVADKVEAEPAMGPYYAQPSWDQRLKVIFALALWYRLK